MFATHMFRDDVLLTQETIALNLTHLARNLRQRKQELTVRQQRIVADLQRTRDLHGGFADQVAQRYNDQVLTGLLDTAEQELGQIDTALRRIDRGTYDTCVRCGTTIPLERLAVVPFTDCCAACADAVVAVVTETKVNR